MTILQGFNAFFGGMSLLGLISFVVTTVYIHFKGDHLGWGAMWLLLPLYGGGITFGAGLVLFGLTWLFL
jgi:hypothetical protein